MNNTLMVYLSKRLRQRNNKYPTFDHQPGPVICISKEVGCEVLNIDQMLATELDKYGNCKKWRVLNKEILEENAMELIRQPNQLSSYLNAEDQYFLDELLSTFSNKHFGSDLKINRILIDLVTSFAIDGHCIITGSMSHMMESNIEKSVFIKLVAPYEWRIKHIMDKNNLNKREAIEYIERTENERQNFGNFFVDKNDMEFDLIINLSKMNLFKVIEFIKFVAQSKGLLESVHSKVEVF